MLFYVSVVILFTIGSFQRIEGRGILFEGSSLNTGSPDEVQKDLRVKRDATTAAPAVDPAKQKELAAAEKHRSETIAKYRKEAQERNDAIVARSKTGLSPETESTPEKSPSERLDSEIKGLEDELAEASGSQDTKPKKKKKKVVVIKESGGGCNNLLGKLGCILG